MSYSTKGVFLIARGLSIVSAQSLVSKSNTHSSVEASSDFDVQVFWQVHQLAIGDFAETGSDNSQLLALLSVVVRNCDY